MTDELKALNNEELENVSGGESRAEGWYMSVCLQSGYLALRPDPAWDQYSELAQIPNGAEVFTNGEITNGTGLNGIPCQYRWIRYGQLWGWANADYLR